MVTLISALIAVGLIAFNLAVLGGYRYDLRRIGARTSRVETEMQRLRDDLNRFTERQLDALWNKAQQEIDREITKARMRYRQ